MWTAFHRTNSIVRSPFQRRPCLVEANMVRTTCATCPIPSFPMDLLRPELQPNCNRRMSCWISLESSLASPSTRYRSNIGCVFWTAVRATSSCATIVSLSTHSGLSDLGCFDYDVGVPTLYKGFGFPCPLVGWSGQRLPRLERLESP